MEQLPQAKLGLSLAPKKDGEKTAVELKESLTKPDKPTGTPGEGRPKNSKDTEEKKRKVHSYLKPEQVSVSGRHKLKNLYLK